ncbi:hypothetical protein PV-S19_0393 [Pacmanvirus S19]|nr:hypothetical protein PV-S19_0393 [Pacmanvirus S19]
MTDTTIEALPVEIISKIINPFSSNYLVCKLWNVIANELVNFMLNQHKKQFAATLTEINSIKYTNYGVMDNEPIGRYITIHSVRQYKNKISVYDYNTVFNCPFKYGTGSIHTLLVRTHYYEYIVGDICEDTNYTKKLKIQPDGPYYKYNILYEIMGIYNNEDEYIVRRYETTNITYEVYYNVIKSN